MKIIDHTPYYNEKGKITFSDRLRASLKYGRTWLSEMEAQKSVLPVLEKNLDRRFVLLRNVSLPGLDASIPFILIGPPGVSVIYVTNLVGMYRARGDQWATGTGNNLKPEKINLLTRTDQLARAVQQYLNSHGIKDLSGVEPVLLCCNPSIHVDSIRPIVRIVLRDALERFAISLTEAVPILTHDRVYRMVDLITIPAQGDEQESPGTAQQVSQLPEQLDQPTTASISLGSMERQDRIHPVYNPDQQTPSGVAPAWHSETKPPLGDYAPQDVTVSPETTPDTQPVTGASGSGSNIYLSSPPSENETVTRQSAFAQNQVATSSIGGGGSGESIQSISQRDAPGTWDTPTTRDTSGAGLIPLQSEIPVEQSTSPLPESLFPRDEGKPLLQKAMSHAPARKKTFNRHQWLVLALLAATWIILVGIVLFFILKDLL
jgi:hypothetical protein